MTAEELNYLFTSKNFKSIDFIKWAKGLGFDVDPATVSRHRSGKQGITIPWGISYKYFFNYSKCDG